MHDWFERFYFVFVAKIKKIATYVKTIFGKKELLSDNRHNIMSDIVHLTKSLGIINNE